MAAIRTAFYIGGQYVQSSNGLHRMHGQMYVEHLVPANTSNLKPLPLIFIHGGTRTGADWLTKPDGNPGWAEWFLAHQYEVYLLDLPFRGRSPWEPSIGEVATFSAEKIQEMFTACAIHGTWPQAKLHTQWPGAGVKGDPIFDRFFASGVQNIRSQAKQEGVAQTAIAALLDHIGREVVLISHSNGGGIPYLVADVRPRLVRLIVSVEPKGPPFDGGKLSFGISNQYGVSQAPIKYDPPVMDPVRDLVRETRKADDPDLLDAILQADSPAPRRLVNLARIPVLLVTAQASYHVQYDWCSVAYLRQVGVQTEHMKLWERGILGNGHMMFMEKNSDDIDAAIEGWIAEKVSKEGPDRG